MKQINVKQLFEEWILENDNKDEIKLAFKYLFQIMKAEGNFENATVNTRMQAISKILLLCDLKMATETIKTENSETQE